MLLFSNFCHVLWIILHSSGELLIQMICKNIYVHEKNFNFSLLTPCSLDFSFCTAHSSGLTRKQTTKHQTFSDFSSDFHSCVCCNASHTDWTHVLIAKNVNILLEKYCIHAVAFHLYPKLHNSLRMPVSRWKCKIFIVNDFWNRSHLPFIFQLSIISTRYCCYWFCFLTANKF